MNLDILKIASDTENHGVINNCTHHSKLKNPICGDEMEIFLIIKNDTIEKFKYQCKSCIYCQASVSLLSKKIIKKRIELIKNFLNKAELFFETNKKLIEKDWKDFEIIMNKNNIARKECLLLPIKVLRMALENKK